MNRTDWQKTIHVDQMKLIDFTDFNTEIMREFLNSKSGCDFLKTENFEKKHEKKHEKVGF